MSDETLPPHKPRRREVDHINWPKVAKYVLMSLPLWGPGLWTGFGYLLTAHAQWLVFAELPGRIAALEATAKEHDEIAKKIASLERYRCILGYDPGGKLGMATILPRDRRAECRTPAPAEVLAAAPAERPEVR